jgi:hypothetical protein
MRKPNGRRPPVKATEAGAPIASINYDEAVREGTQPVTRHFITALQLRFQRQDLAAPVSLRSTCG